MAYTLTAIFQFADSTLDYVALFSGSRDECEEIERRLEHDTGLGLGGIRYDGSRDEPPVQAVTVVHRTEEPPR